MARREVLYGIKMSQTDLSPQVPPGKIRIRRVTDLEAFNCAPLLRSLTAIGGTGNDNDFAPSGVWFVHRKRSNSYIDLIDVQQN
jgi:hypothetical protein